MRRRRIELEDISWKDRGACLGADLNLFLPPLGERKDERRVREQEAKEICGRCAVMEQCLNWALQHNEHGVWGGTSDEDRKKLR